MQATSVGAGVEPLMDGPKGAIDQSLAERFVKRVRELFSQWVDGMPQRCPQHLALDFWKKAHFPPGPNPDRFLRF